MSAFTVQMDEEFYRICGPDGEEGPMVPYGTMATLEIDEAVYYCQVEDGNEEHPKVCEVASVKYMDTETEDVEFPKEVCAAQRALDAAIEKQTAAIDATAEEIVEGEDDDEDDEKP